MLHRFRSVVASVMGGIAALPQPPEKNTHSGMTENNSNNTTTTTTNNTLEIKYAYSRPDFLQLNWEEVQVSADHTTRPILVPRDLMKIPWNAGYAEVINAGKSRYNEDQSTAQVLWIRRPNECGYNHHLFANPLRKAKEFMGTSDLDDDDDEDAIPATYFGVFDGHAGTGAALMTVNTFHFHLEEKLSSAKDVILSRLSQDCEESNEMSTLCRQVGLDHNRSISVDNLVIGALEAAFCAMDEQIGRERLIFKITGGCTALVALFFLGKLYIANAGDCRAVLVRGREVIPMSRDFTPETERQRLQYLGNLQPELLHNEFTHLEFPRRVHKKDIGKKMLHRNAQMQGWTLKTITEDDLKFPLVYGEGKRTRVLATIGVTRGFGDHDLKVHDSNIYVKPFLTPMPEVKVYDMSNYDHTEDDFLIMGSDGLWDVTSNTKAADIVRKCLEQFHKDETHRYASAAQELVMFARGILKKGWRTENDRPASGDDISCFVIPLNQYCNMDSQSSSTESSVDIT